MHQDQPFIVGQNVKACLKEHKSERFEEEKFQFPYSIEVESQIYHTRTVSTLLGCVIFGEKISKLHKLEIIN